MSSDINKFMSFVSPEPNSGCWLWMGACDSEKRGFRSRFYDKKSMKMVLAYRWIYQHIRKVVLDSKNACHKCDNPNCVNPDHIFIGTQKDNMLDAFKKGRMDGRYHGVPWNKLIAHCKRGHELSGDNLVKTKKGGRLCGACHRMTKNARRARLREAGVSRPS